MILYRVLSLTERLVPHPIDRHEACARYAAENLTTPRRTMIWRRSGRVCRGVNEGEPCNLSIRVLTDEFCGVVRLAGASSPEDQPVIEDSFLRHVVGSAATRAPSHSDLPLARLKAREAVSERERRRTMSSTTAVNALNRATAVD